MDLTGTLVYSRDASLFNHPDTSAPKRRHRESDTCPGTAFCAPGSSLGAGNRVIPLIMDWGFQDAGVVNPDSLCRRCFPLSRR